MVYSHDYPDGLSAGAFAYMKNSPVILTRTKANSQVQAKAYIQGQVSLKEGYVIGGEMLISDDAVVALFDMKEAGDIKVEYRAQ